MWLLYCVMVSIVIETHGYYDGEIGYFGYEDDLKLGSYRNVSSTSFPLNTNEYVRDFGIEETYALTRTKPYGRNSIKVVKAKKPLRSRAPVIHLTESSIDVEDALRKIFMGRNISEFSTSPQPRKFRQSIVTGFRRKGTPGNSSLVPDSNEPSGLKISTKDSKKITKPSKTKEKPADKSKGNKGDKSKDKTKKKPTKTTQKRKTTKRKTTRKTTKTTTTKRTTTKRTTTTTASTGPTVLTECKPVQTTTTERVTTTKRMEFDIDKFLAIVANLTYEYYTNLTEQVNETLIKLGAPTCPTPSTKPDYEADKARYRGRCYMCGLEDEGIPRDADCADAFSGDFVPLLPRNSKAKGKLKYFRKYCMYENVPNYQVNETTPKSVYGRFTGGCSVRWTDVTGVYTQRACRSRYKAITGKHFGSKRMAKLEMTLLGQDNGCIATPVASLLPLSRGISLYARFYACVCTGNLCNATSRLEPAWCAPAILYWTMKFLYTSMSNVFNVKVK